MTSKYRFSYIFIAIAICVCINTVFSGKAEATVADDVKAAVDAGKSYADAVTDVINAGGDPAEVAYAATTLGGPGVAAEVTTAAIAAIFASGVDAATAMKQTNAVRVAAISAGGNEGDVNAAYGIATGVGPAFGPGGGAGGGAGFGFGGGGQGGGGGTPEQPSASPSA